MTKSWRDGPLVTGSLASHIITTRNIAQPDRFRQPQWPDDLHDPMALPDMAKAIDRLWRAIQAKETIGIVGDYDMDGTPAAALLSQFLNQFGLDPHVILPTRADGYGFSPEFVNRLVKQGVTLIVTVDCGIRDVAAVEQASQHKCDVIILDHHECDTVLPPALAIVNPKRPDCTYPFRDLCGTAVVFKCLSALHQKYSAKFPASVPAQWLAWSLDLVALATLGDMVSLQDENRVFVWYGLKVIQRGSRKGLARFIEAVGLNTATLTYTDITFKIIPKLNASGRLESMDDVLTLLTATDIPTIDVAIQRILTRDTQRQLLSTSILEQAKVMMEEQQASASNTAGVTVLWHPQWHPGVTGLVAARLSESYHRPVAVLGTLDGDLYRGSLRSYQAVDLPALLQQAGSTVERYGGHREAAGVSVRQSQLEAFRDVVTSSAVVLDAPEAIATDGTITAHDLTRSNLQDLEQLAPWGMGHPEPLWSLAQVNLCNVAWIGERKNHLKATLLNVVEPCSLLWFGAEQWQGFNFSQPVDIYGTLSLNTFRGTVTPQLMLKGLVPSQ